jgi:hypothetical protein
VLLVPFLGLWRFEPLMLLGAAPDLALDLLSSKPEQSTIFYHYTAGIVPFVVAASVLGAARRKGNPARITHWVFAVVCCLAVISPLWTAASNVDRARSSNPVHAATRRALDLVPPHASVSASQSLGAYLSARRNISVFPNVKRAEWVAVGKLRDGEDNPKAFRATLVKLRHSPYWRVVFDSNGITVLERRAGAQ